ncbi:MAG: hypothetical protein ACPLTR_06005 [Thermacetogeniaceae bacterium]
MDEIIVKLPKCVVVLTRGELMTLLKANPTIWERALKRGKAFMRAQLQERREPKGGE